MMSLLIKLMTLAALVQLGLSTSHLGRCHSRACARMFESHSRDVLRVDWKPISVFPEESRRFH